MFIPLHDANPRQHIHYHYATLGLIVANVAIYFLFQNRGFDAVYGFTLVPAALAGEVLRPDAVSYLPEPATLLTYAFLHADIWHLGGNMLFLWVFGDNVEDAMGHWRFLAFCAIGAGALQFALAPDALTHIIGASGAIAGVIAAYLLLHPRVRIWVLLLGRIPLRLSAAWVLGGWIVYQLWNAFGSRDITVAWWTHVGGILTGGLLILVMRRRGTALLDRDLQAD